MHYLRLPEIPARRLIVLALSIVILVAVLSLSLYLASRQHLNKQLALEQDRLGWVSVVLAGHLEGLVMETLVLSTQPVLQAFIEEGDAQQRGQLLDELAQAARTSPNYDQVRYIDRTGWERARVDRVDGRLRRLPTRLLQNKAQRDYVIQGLELEPGQVLLTALEPNREWRRPTWPLHPTLRAVTPVTGADDQIAGLIVINLDGGFLLDQIARLMPDSKGQLWIVAPQKAWRQNGSRHWHWMEGDHPVVAALTGTQVGRLPLASALLLVEPVKVEERRVMYAQVVGPPLRLGSLLSDDALWSLQLAQMPQYGEFFLPLILLAALALGLVVRFYPVEVDADRALRRAMARHPDGFLVLSGGVCREVNDRALRLLDRPREVVLGQPFHRWLTQTSLAELAEPLAAIEQGQPLPARRADIKRPDDSLLPVEIWGFDRRVEQRPCAVVLMRDISHSIRLLKTEEQIIQTALKSAPILMFGQDMQLRYTWVANLPVGLSKEDFLGQRDHDLLSDAAEIEALARIKQDVINRGRGRRDEVRVTLAGVTHIFDLVTDPLYNESGQLTGLTCAAYDVTEHKAQEARLAERALHDALTGLPNRILLTDRIHHALERTRCQGNSPMVAVAFLDLDRFKRINDTLGHGVGDGLLIQVAKRLKAHVRSFDTVARLAGDEFVLVLEELNKVQDVMEVAGKIIEVMKEPFHVEGHDIYAPASIGLSLYPRDGNQPQSLLRYADAALKQAKNRGRGQLCLYQTRMVVDVDDRLALEQELRQAIRDQTLVLHYQPIADVATGRVVAVEALSRWQHPVRGFISPDRFIRVAEEAGLILDLDNYVLGTACNQAATWHDLLDHPIQVAVNLSAQQFQQPGLPHRLARLLREHNLSPDRLVLEITEGLVMQELTDALDTLRVLQSMGVTVAIDDFGSGYSSLNYLRHLPVDRLKIDKTFILELEQDGNAAIVKASIVMAHALGLKVVAEGVETPRQLESLRRMGCDLAQGWAIGRPASAADLRLTPGIDPSTAERPASAKAEIHPFNPRS